MLMPRKWLRCIKDWDHLKSLKKTKTCITLSFISAGIMTKLCIKIVFHFLNMTIVSKKSHDLLYFGVANTLPWQPHFYQKFLVSLCNICARLWENQTYGAKFQFSVECCKNFYLHWTMYKFQTLNTCNFLLDQPIFTIKNAF